MIRFEVYEFSAGKWSINPSGELANLLTYPTALDALESLGLTFSEETRIHPYLRHAGGEPVPISPTQWEALSPLFTDDDSTPEIATDEAVRYISGDFRGFVFSGAMAYSGGFHNSSYTVDYSGTGITEGTFTRNTNFRRTLKWKRRNSTKPRSSDSIAGVPYELPVPVTDWESDVAANTSFGTLTRLNAGETEPTIIRLGGVSFNVLIYFFRGVANKSVHMSCLISGGDTLSGGYYGSQLFFYTGTPDVTEQFGAVPTNAHGIEYTEVSGVGPTILGVRLKKYGWMAAQVVGSERVDYGLSLTVAEL